MSEEAKKISIQVPDKFLKELSAAAEKAKAAEGQTQVTLQFSAEGIALLGELRRDIVAFQEAQVAASHAALDRFSKNWQLRTGFYEKPILLAGGSFALSLTLLGYLHRAALHPTPLAAMGRLKAAWILLLVCIILSWLHNLHRFNAIDHATVANAQYATSMQQTWQSYLLTRTAALFGAAESPSVGLGAGIKAFAQVLESLSKQSKESGAATTKEFEQYYRISAVLGALALLSIITAFVLLMIFAAKNTPLL